MTNILGCTIRNAAIGSNPISREIKPPGTSIVKFELSRPLYPYAGDDNILREVGYLLEEHFSLAVISFFQGQLAAGKTIYAATESFYNHYGLSEEDYGQEALRKIWRDHQARRKPAGTA